MKKQYLNIFEKKESLVLNFTSDNQIFIEIVGPMGLVKKFYSFTNSSFAFKNLNKSSLFFNLKKNFCLFKGLIYSTFLALTKGFYFEFIIRGIGYKYKFFRKNGIPRLLFKLGFGHRVFFNLNELVTFNNNKRFDFLISSFDKAVLTKFAEELRIIKETDSYKGKGIKYYQVPLKLKVGKIR